MIYVQIYTKTLNPIVVLYLLFYICYTCTLLVCLTTIVCHLQVSTEEGKLCLSETFLYIFVHISQQDEFIDNCVVVSFSDQLLAKDKHY